MADRGIIFSAPMVRALLDGRKTQTRRLLLHPEYYGCPTGDCPHTTQAECDAAMAGLTAKEANGFAPGDRLYVRESCYLPPKHISDRDIREGADTWPKVIFAEDDREGGRDMMERCGWRSAPSIHMPRWASRLWLAVTDVRVQRLQDISEADAIAEGIVSFHPGNPPSIVTFYHHTVPEHRNCGFINARRAYEDLWDSLHTEPGTRWDDNPWVVAVSFDVNRGNIDQVKT